MSRFLVRSSTVAAVVAAAALLLSVVAGPAAAHSALLSSNPENGAKVATAPNQVTLTFNEDLKPEYAVMKIVGPDNHFWQSGEPVITGKQISVAIDDLGPTGEYKVNFKVTSADGHPVQGQVVFELTAAGSGQPGPVADDWEPEADHGVQAWGFIVGGVVLFLVIAGALALVLVKRRR